MSHLDMKEVPVSSTSAYCDFTFVNNRLTSVWYGFFFDGEDPETTMAFPAEALISKYGTASDYGMEHMIDIAAPAYLMGSNIPADGYTEAEIHEIMRNDPEFSHADYRLWVLEDGTHIILCEYSGEVTLTYIHKENFLSEVITPYYNSDKQNLSGL